MWRIVVVILAIVTVLVSPNAAWAEWYRVDVTRRDSNLYQVHNTPYYIITRYCYEYVYYESAVLRYEPYSFSNKLYFNSGSDCDVERILRR